MNFPELKTGVQPEFSSIYNFSKASTTTLRGDYYNPDRTGTRDCCQETPCIQSIPVVIDDSNFDSVYRSGNTISVPKGTLVGFYAADIKRGPRCVSQPDAISRVVFLSGDVELPEDNTSPSQPPNIVFPLAEAQNFTKHATHSRTISHVSVCVSGYSEVIVPGSSQAFNVLPGDTVFAYVHGHHVSVGTTGIGTRYLLGKNLFKHKHTENPATYTTVTVSLTPMRT